MSASFVNKTNSQYSRNKLLQYNSPITGCGNMRGGGNDNLSKASYGFINGDNNRMYSNSRPEMSSLSKPMSCKLVGGKRSRRNRISKKKMRKSFKKRRKTKITLKDMRNKISKKKSRKITKKTGRKLLNKWIKQIKKFRKRTLKGGSKSQTTSHFVHQTPGTTTGSKAGILANPTSYTVKNNCIDNYNHYKQN